MIGPVLAALLAAGSGQVLSLGQAQDVLLAKSPELRTEKLAEQKAAALLNEAKASYWPSLDAYASYQAFSEANHLHSDLPGALPTIDQDLGDKDREEYGIDLTYPLSLGGRLRQQALARGASARAAQESVRVRQNQLSLRLVSLFYAWHMADAARETQAATARAYEDAWNRVTAEVKQGGALKSREAAARARWLNARVEWQAAVDARDSLSRAAALLLGLPPEAPLVFTLDSARPDGTARASSANAEAKRPELRMLDRTAESLDHQARGLQGQRLPTLAAMAGYRIANPGLNLGSDEYMNYGLIGLQLKWNLFDGFRNRSQLAQVRSQREAVDVERERQAAFWSEAALSADRYADRLELSLQAAEAALEAARESAREKAAQVRQGSASELEWIDARVLEAKAALQVRQLTLQGRLAQWQKRFARGETLVFPRGE